MYGNIEDPSAETRIRDNVRYHSSLGPHAISDRIRQLDAEWDMEQSVTATLSCLGAFGLVMGLFGGRVLRLLTWVSIPFLLLFSLGKWAPSAAALSRWGLRRRREIEEERYALKALRGDFKDVAAPTGAETDSLGRKADQVMDAVRA